MRRVIELPKYDWSIVCFIGYQPPDADEICHALSDIGCNGNPLSEAYVHLTKESVDRGSYLFQPFRKKKCACHWKM